MKRETIRLAVKDFQVQGRSIRSYITTILVIVPLILLFGGLNQTRMKFSTAAFILLYRFINSSLYEDEKNNTLRLLASLPIRREAVVKARYLSTGILILVLTFAVGIISAFTGGDDTGVSDVLGLFMVFVYIILISICMPIGFKLGYIRAANISRLIFFGIFMLFGAIPALLGGVTGQQDHGMSTEFMVPLATEDLVLLAGIFAVVTLLLYIVSMKVAVVFYKRRNLF